MFFRFYHHKHLPLNKALRIMLFTNALILIASAMLAPIYAIFVEKIGGDLLDASYASALYSLISGLGVYVMAKYSNKIKEKELVVVAGYIIIAIGFLAYLFVQNVWNLLFVQIIIGLGVALYSPPWDTIYSEHLSKTNETTQWGAWESVNHFTVALGSFIGGLVVSFFGFNALFILMSTLSLASAIYIYKLPRNIL